MAVRYRCNGVRQPHPLRRRGDPADAGVPPLQRGRRPQRGGRGGPRGAHRQRGVPVVRARPVTRIETVPVDEGSEAVSCTSRGIGEPAAAVSGPAARPAARRRGRRAARRSSPTPCRRRCGPLAGFDRRGLTNTAARHQLRRAFDLDDDFRDPRGRGVRRPSGGRRRARRLDSGRCASRRAHDAAARDDLAVLTSALYAAQPDGFEFGLGVACAEDRERRDARTLHDDLRAQTAQVAAAEERRRRVESDLAHGARRRHAARSRAARGAAWPPRSRERGRPAGRRRRRSGRARPRPASTRPDRDLELAETAGPARGRPGTRGRAAAARAEAGGDAAAGRRRLGRVAAGRPRPRGPRPPRRGSWPTSSPGRCPARRAACAAGAAGPGDSRGRPAPEPGRRTRGAVPARTARRPARGSRRDAAHARRRARGRRLQRLDDGLARHARRPAARPVGRRARAAPPAAALRRRGGVRRRRRRGRHAPAHAWGAGRVLTGRASRPTR